MMINSDSLNSGDTPPLHKFFVSDKTSAFSKTVGILMGDDAEISIEQADVENL